MIGVITVLTGAALLAKTVAERSLTTPGAAGPVVPDGPLQLRLLYNRGVAFGLGEALPPWLVATATGAITAVILGYTWRSGWKQPTATRWAVTAVAAGAAANLLDRLPDGAVTDYLHTGWFPTFNLADVLITTGAVLFAFSTLHQDLEPRRHTDGAQER